MTHTATPWALNRDEIPPIIYADHQGEDGQKCIALLDGSAAFPNVDKCEANAEFIVRACNAYDKDQETIADLVRVLQDILEQPKETMSDGKALTAIVRIAKRALAKAQA
jgi:hypothetical protein